METRTLFQPVAEAEVSPAVQAATPAPETTPSQPIEPPAQRCVVDADHSKSRWDYQAVSALEIVSLEVTNRDGSAPWTTGEPRVSAVMRNTTGQFLNYPSLQVSASEPSLTPHQGDATDHEHPIQCSDRCGCSNRPGWIQSASSARQREPDSCVYRPG